MFADASYAGPVTGRDMLRATIRPQGWSDADVEHVKALYDAEIRYTDDTLGAILDALAARGLLEDSIVALTADHGEAFYEHGRFGHRWTLHEEETRIPLVIKAPGTRPNVSVDRPASIIDVAPTLLDLAGVPPLPDALGRSLAPLLRDPAAALAEELAVSELTVPTARIHDLAIRDRTWKVVFDLARRSARVYDLASDPHEAAPVATGSGPLTLDEVDTLYRTTVGRLDGAAGRLPRPGIRSAPAIPRDTEEHLRSLGYVQ
jgi:arylsulfatase A-like enzyme